MCMTGVWAVAGTYVRGHCLEAHFWLHWRMFGILSPSLSLFGLIEKGKVHPLCLSPV